MESCKDYDIVEYVDGKRMLEADLYDDEGRIRFNRIELYPLLRDVVLRNHNGQFKYEPTPDKIEEVVSALCPVYTGAVVERVSIKKCVFLSVHQPKYQKALHETLNHLKRWKMPPISVHYGYSWSTANESSFYECMKHSAIDGRRPELTCAMLEVFDAFARENEPNEWLLYCEDDVRATNVEPHDDLRFLHNVPEDAEMVRPYIGKNSRCSIKDAKYRPSYGGWSAHALYVSGRGCRKVVDYARKHGWRFECDFDMFRMTRSATQVPIGIMPAWWDGISSDWRLGPAHSCNIPDVLDEHEKLAVYHTDHVLWNQTSLPVAKPLYPNKTNTTPPRRQAYAGPSCSRDDVNEEVAPANVVDNVK